MKEKEISIGILIKKKKSNLKIFDEINGFWDFSNEGIVKVTRRNIDLIFSTLGSFEGIPITEEWLLKFGYKRLKDHLYIEGHLVWAFDGMFICDKNRVILKYVHQLQNLYFALTNEELIWKQSY